MEGQVNKRTTFFEPIITDPAVFCPPVPFACLMAYTRLLYSTGIWPYFYHL